MDDRAQEHTLVKARTYALVWLGLLMLTGLTVALTGVPLGRLSILGAILIASVKSTLVLSFFMHLRYERRIFMAIFLGTMVILTIFIGFTFFDIAYR
ncbi:MAG: cytochrome C oxidase subunit IV family protein [Candidatus Binatia bacterium]